MQCFGSVLVTDILHIFCHCIYSRAYLYFHVYCMLFSCHADNCGVHFSLYSIYSVQPVLYMKSF